MRDFPLLDAPKLLWPAVTGTVPDHDHRFTPGSGSMHTYDILECDFLGLSRDVSASLLCGDKPRQTYTYNEVQLCFILS